MNSTKEHAQDPTKKIVSLKYAINPENILEGTFTSLFQSLLPSLPLALNLGNHHSSLAMRNMTHVYV